MEIKLNSVYVIPPNYDLIYREGIFHLIEHAEPHSRRMPIDLFFRSLAEEKEEKAIGIVLSGTGSDGTLGIRAIKAEGGMVMAQTPESSEYDSMPLNVIDTGLADYILPPNEMAANLISYIVQVFGKTPYSPSSKEEIMNRIFNLIFTQTGHDFSHYKKGTITRRIERRMAVHAISDIEEYVSYLDQNPAEIEALFRDFLISVTNFFRNSKAFEALEKEVIPKIFVGKNMNETIRIWVPGCSTGEEAYSLGILLQEHMEALKRTFKIQIFATDIDIRAIERARTGVYPASIAVDISSERLERFFSLGPDGNYRINKNIREMIIFSEHDLIKDPPFSRLDLLSCRNLLIYMDSNLQKRLIPLFYYALNPGKFLFLGSSETIDGFTNLFHILNSKAKLYQTRENIASEELHSITALIPARFGFSEVRKRGNEIHPNSRPKFSQVTEQILLRNYAPASVLINEEGEILYLHGRTGMYLEPAPGDAGMNILKMAREGLNQRLTVALHRAITDKKPIFYPEVQVKTNGNYIQVNLRIIPVISTPFSLKEPDLFLIIFEEPIIYETEKTENGSKASEGGTPETSSKIDKRVVKLMEELQLREEELKATNEELETSTEELKSSNEEMQSINEELQSSNEELESSKEELQSVNEELATVNAELQNKITDLSQANNDMNNLLAGTDIGTIFVDYGMRIMRFTPAITSLINVIPTDVGRPIGDIVPNFQGYDILLEDIKEVLEKLTSKEIEIQTRDNNWYLMRIRPYRTLDNIIKGAVLTFTDISKRKQAEAEREEALIELAKKSRFFEATLSSIPDFVYAFDHDRRFVYVNQTMQNLFGLTALQMLGKNFADLDYPPELAARLNSHIDTVFQTGKRIEDEVFYTSPIGISAFFEFNWGPVMAEDGTVEMVVGVSRDTTERRRLEKELRKREERFRAFVTASSEVVYRMNPDWSEMNQLYGRGFLADTENPNSSWLQEYILPEDQPEIIPVINEAIRTKTIFKLEHRVRKADGSVGWVYSRAIPILDENNEIIEWFGAASDITSRKQGEEKLEKKVKNFEEKYNECED